MRKHRLKPCQPTHERRAFYRSAELAHAQIAAVEIPDPYGTPSDATAKPEPGLRRDGTQAAGELEWRAPEAPRLVVVRNLRGDQIARMEARHQITGAQFAAGRHYQALHEVAFASALRSLDLKEDAIRRLRVIDGTLTLQLGVDVLELLQAVLLGGRPVVGASRQHGGAKASYWRMALRLALDEIAAIVGLGDHRSKRPPVPERYALQAAVVVTTVRRSAPLGDRVDQRPLRRQRLPLPHPYTGI